MKKKTGIVLMLICVVIFTGCGQKGNAEVISDGMESTTGKKELTIFVLNKNDTLKKIAGLYEVDHPQVKIKFDTGKSADSNLTETEVLNRLNTELLNGEGPDLICFDGFGTEGYEELLADVSGIVRRNEKDCYSNILNAYEENGQVLSVPLRFALTGIYTSLTAACGTGTPFYKVVENSAALKDMADFLRSTDIRLPKDSDTAMVTLWCRVYAAEIVHSQTENRDIPSFFEFLDMILDKCGSSLTERQDETLSLETLAVKGVDRNEYIEPVRKDMDLAFKYLSNLYFAPDYAQANTDEGWEFYNLWFEDAVYFEAKSVMGVTRGGGNEDMAFDFMDYALSKEAQMECDDFSWSVNRSVMEEKMKNPQRSTTVYVNEAGEESGGEYVVPTEEQMAGIDRLIGTADTPISNERILVNFLLEPYEDYRKGKCTRKEAARAAEQKIGLYLMEHAQ